MKSTHNKYVTREEAEKMVSVGKPFEPVSDYTKNDFLNSSQIAKKFKIGKKEASDLLKKLQKYNVSFVLNGHRCATVTKMGTNSFYLHPKAIDVFSQYLEKQKGIAK